jgi:hypothetical protein
MIFATRFGALSHTASELSERDTVACQDDMSRYARVIMPIRRRSVHLEIKLQGLGDTTPYVVTGGKSQQVTDAFSFDVSVEWDGDTPMTRRPGLDNADVVLLQPNGDLIDIQVSLITRSESFFIVAQRVWQGEVVRTRGNRPGTSRLLYIPGRAVHAFPGSSYEGAWANMAEAVLAEARENQASKQLSRTEAAKWQPPILPPPNGGGWIPGTVYFFNMVTGTGRIVDAQGKKYFVHFNNIVNGGEVPVLTPMTTVLFRPGIEKPGKDTPVKSVKLPNQH